MVYVTRSVVQVDRDVSRTYGGTGLGLAISKQFAELMDGYMGVSSEVGVGSLFWFSAVFKRSTRSKTVVRNVLSISCCCLWQSCSQGFVRKSVRIILFEPTSGKFRHLYVQTYLYALMRPHAHAHTHIIIRRETHKETERK